MRSVTQAFLLRLDGLILNDTRGTLYNCHINRKEYNAGRRR